MEILVEKSRMHQSITQKELSEFVGISRQHLSRIENGYEPKVGVALKIAKGLDATVEQLFIID